MLRTRETKLEIVKKHLEDGITLKELSDEYGMHTSDIKYYIALYRKHGERVFTNPLEVLILIKKKTLANPKSFYCCR